MWRRWTRAPSRPTPTPRQAKAAGQISHNRWGSYSPWHGRAKAALASSRISPVNWLRAPSRAWRGSESSETLTLFVSQRLDRIETRSFPGGIVAEDDADRGGDGDGGDDGGCRWH